MFVEVKVLQSSLKRIPVKCTPLSLEKWIRSPHIGNKSNTCSTSIRAFQLQKKKASQYPENKQAMTKRYCPIVGVKRVGDIQRSFEALIPVHNPSLQSCQDYVVGKEDILWKHPRRHS